MRACIIYARRGRLAGPQQGDRVETVYDHDRLNALEAVSAAQKIAFAPILFQAVWCLRETGLLAALERHDRDGASLETLVDDSGLTPYAVGVLLDMGLSGGVLFLKSARYRLTRVGHYLLNDPMTRTNMDFTQHTCYEAMRHLLDAIRSGKPSGLQVFGDWPTIYPALGELPDEARESWFEFDHFYSDQAFSEALAKIFHYRPAHIYDVGGNTGKWALRCARHDPDVRVTLLDLPQQLALAQDNIEREGLAGRIDGWPVDILKAEQLPGDADLWWMSQFLDCFSEDEIVHILKLIGRSMRPDARLAIMELFWDRQRFEAAAFSLNATSLYFTCLANGNSRFYHSKVMLKCLRLAGFHVEDEYDDLGKGHTLLICRKLADA